MKNIKTYKLFENHSIYKTIHDNDYERLQDFIDGGGDLDFDEDGQSSILTWTILHGTLKSTKILVNNGINLDYDTNQEENALFIACSKAKYQTAKFLLEAGINANYQGYRGQSALMRFGGDSTKMFKLLAEYVDWSITDDNDEDVFDKYVESYTDIIINLYPEKYKKYLRNKKKNEFNL